MARGAAFAAARQSANESGKPLLVVGCPSSHPFAHPCGDVCLDNNPARLAQCRAGEQWIADIGSIPSPDNYFGAVLCSHVLEHLESPQAVEQAYNELRRVADSMFILCPSKLNPAAWIHPDHHLWVTVLGDGSLLVEPRGR